MTPGSEFGLLADARRAVLATTRADGRPRLVPLAFAADQAASPLVIYSALDEKPKSVADVRQLGRVRDLLARPQVSVLVDRWSEDWSELAWLRLDGTAEMLDPADAGAAAEHAHALSLLRGRYAQYATQDLEGRPVIRITVERVASWSAGR